LATGRVLQFDHVRGYGFVAAEDGGEDIFLHASVFDGDSDLLSPGMHVEFQVMSGDRGRKAYAARVLQDKFHGDGRPLPVQPNGSEQPLPVQPVVPIQAQTDEEIVAPQAQTVPDQGNPADVPDDEEQLCDVLSPDEFTHALTELLLGAVPGLTGQEILDVRQTLLEFAQQHGWSDG
jgi:CspA family cold shock protein